MFGKLFLVATPIGNLKDMTQRAVDTLREADLVVCEDTRHSKTLLTAYGINKPLFALFQGKEAGKTQRILEKLESGSNIAFITDAGTPNVSDPGYRLVAECSAKGIPVIPIPGPSALICALSASGLPTDAFVFEGFPPPKSGARLRKMESWKEEPRTVIYYESPHRIERSLEDLQKALGDIEVVLARELTKKFEEIHRARISAHLDGFKKKPPLGEFTVLFNLRMQKDAEA